MTRKGLQLTERDLKILALLTCYQAATVAQIKRELFKRAVSVAYRRLAALEGEKLVKHRMVYHGQPGVYMVTAPGAREVGLGLSAPRLSKRTLDHTLAVLDLSWATRFGRKGDGAGADEWDAWITERELWRDKNEDRRDEETGRLKAGPKKGRTPDGLLVLRNGEEVAVELELVPKSDALYKSIFSDYARQLDAGLIDAVRWYFAGKTAMPRVEELSRRYEALSGRIEFRHWTPLPRDSGSHGS